MSSGSLLSLGDLVLTEFGIGLMPDHGVTHLLTPTFLSLNGIVPEDWAVLHPVVTTAESAEIGYTNGFVVRADAGEVGFIYDVPNALPEAAVLCARVSTIFVGRMPGLLYERVRFDVHGFVMMPEGSPGIRNIGTDWQNTLPIIAHEARYSLNDGMMVDFFAREVSRVQERFIDCVDFRAVSTYVIGADVDSSEWVKELVAGWESELQNFAALVAAFWDRHLVH